MHFHLQNRVELKAGSEGLKEHTTMFLTFCSHFESLKIVHEKYGLYLTDSLFNKFMDGFEFFSFNSSGINSDRYNSDEQLPFEASTHFFTAQCFLKVKFSNSEKSITSCISDGDISNEITKYCG